jgi:NDP-sugar pyrophosphorylase family protein
MAIGLSGAIVAAGRGDRLRAAAGGIPKPLVELAGEPMIVRQARAMLSLGLSPVHTIVNSETAGLMNDWGVQIPAGVDLCVRDTANSMESLLTLGERIAPGRFVLATVDAVVDQAELRRFVASATKMTDPAGPQRLDGALGVVKWLGDTRPLFAEVAADGLITGLGETTTAVVTAGVYLFSTAIFAYAREAQVMGLDAMRRFLALLIRKGMRFAAIELEGVIDIDEAADLQTARTAVARRAGVTAMVDGGRRRSDRSDT